jgi:HEAT repeat protein
LGQIGDPRALPVLIETLDGGSEDLQQACVQAIGQIGGADSVLRLSQLINEERSERVLTQGAEEISKHGVIEAAWEILPRMHTTANPVLRRQLAIAMGNLLGRPGEFYQYLTSDQVLQGDRVGQLFAAAGRVLGRIEKQSGQPNTVLSRLLRNIRTLAESGRYEKALEDLYGLVQKLAKIKLDLTVQDDDALLYAAVYRDIKLGLALWALKEMNELIPNTGVDADLVRIDTLLIVYFIASYRGQDPETTDRFGHLFRSPSKR